MRLTVVLAFVGALFVALTPGPGVHRALGAPSMVTEVNPDTVTPSSSLKYGGRIEALAINPVNTQIVLAASELGGLWRSTDGANAWSHVDELPLTRMYDVKFAQADPSLVVATGDNDGASPSRGGIWLSSDGGATWSRPATANNDNNGCTDQTPGAHWLDIAGTTPGQLSIFVATDCGIAVSNDSGATWTHHFASGAANARYWDVKTAVVGGVIEASACGDGGLTRSTDGAGATWSAYLGDNSELFGPNALGFPPCHISLAPNDPNTVYISSFKREPAGYSGNECGSLLLTSTDANTATPTWTDLNACPNGDRNGRWPFVETHPDPNNPSTQFQVYFGDNTRITVQTCTYNPTTCAAGPWPYYDGTNPHNGTDPTDIVFDPTIASGCPAFVAGDGGVYQPSDCSTNPPSWNMMNTSLNALDALNIAGTVYSSPAHTDVYFGTQDDGLFVSTDGGATYNRFAYDIYSLNADHAQTPNSPPSHVFWRNAAYSSAPYNHVNFSNEDISSNSVWLTQPPLPPGNDPSDNYSATQFGYNSYAFITPDVAPNPGPANWAMWVTTDAGGTWTQMGPNAPGRPVGFPQASGTATQPTFYVMLKVGGANKLYRLSGPMTSSAVWTDVTSNLVNPTTFGVHPSNPLLLYANDASLNQVMKSTNGGASWVADTNLTTLAQRGGQFPFADGGSQIAAFGFDGNSDTVMAGANNSGVFASTNGGANWFSVTGAENLPRIAGFFFDERTHTIYVASGGRGMWEITLPTADLSITKSHTPDPATAGTELYYSITVSNAGPDAAPAVVVTDNLPAEVQFVTDTLAAPAGCSADSPPPGTGQTVTCNVGDIAASTSVTFTIKVAVNANAVSNAGAPIAITNTASVVSPVAMDLDISNNTAVDTVIVEDLADLRVTKICKPDGQLLAGETATCTIFVDNLGPSDARNVQLTDTILSDGSFTIGTPDPSQGTCSESGGVVTCDLGDLEAASPSVSGRATVAIDVTATEAVDINDVATVVSDTPDPDSTNNEAQGSISVTAVADLQLCKADSPGASLCTTTASSSAGPDPVIAGNSLRYELEVVNTGPSTASNVVVEDDLPSSVTIDSVSAAGGSCNAGVPGDPLLPTTCTFDSLLPGQSSTMIVVVTVKPDTLGIIHNDARVSSDTFDDDNSNDLASEDTTVDAQADLSITKADLPDPVVAGTTLTYELTVVNNGPSDAVGVVVEDALPDEVVFQSATISNGSGTCVLFSDPPNTVSCQLDTVAPNAGSPILIYIDVLVKPDVADGSSIDNAATVSSSTSDPNGGNDSDTTSTAVNAEADLEIQKDGNFETGNPSTTIIYFITVTNHGPSDAQDVTVVDPLPLDPKKVIYVFDTGNGACSYDQSTHTVTCDFGTLASGASVGVNIHVQTKGNLGVITNTATVSSSTTDPDTSNNTARKDMLVEGGSGKTGGPGGGRGKGPNK